MVRIRMIPLSNEEKKEELAPKNKNAISTINLYFLLIAPLNNFCMLQKKKPTYTLNVFFYKYTILVTVHTALFLEAFLFLFQIKLKSKCLGASSFVLPNTSRHNVIF